MSYIVKSVDVAAHRLAEVMADLTKDLQSNTVANLSVPKTLRTKLKPEIKCLKNVISKCCTKGKHTDLEYGFIHILLASKATKYIQQNLPPSDICVLAETMKVFVSHLNFVQLDSSDEEDTDVPDSADKEKQNDAQHFACVLQCLEKAFNIAYNNCSSDIDVNNETAMMQLGECICQWKLGTNRNIRQLNTSNSTPLSDIKYQKAFSLLHHTLFSDSNTDTYNHQNNNSNITKHLSFTGNDEKEAEQITLDVVSEEKQNDDDTQLNSADVLTEDADNDSFATATSSVDDPMMTPEEGLELYING